MRNRGAGNRWTAMPDLSRWIIPRMGFVMLLAVLWVGYVGVLSWGFCNYDARISNELTAPSIIRSRGVGSAVIRSSSIRMGKKDEDSGEESGDEEGKKSSKKNLLSRIFSKEGKKQTDSDVKKKESSGDEGNIFSRTTRKLFSEKKSSDAEKKSGEEVKSAFKKWSLERKVILDSELAVASAIAGRDLSDDDTPKDTKKKTSKDSTDTISRAVKEQQEQKRREASERAAREKERSRARYEKQMRILERNKAVSEAASSNQKRSAQKEPDWASSFLKLGFNETKKDSDTPTPSDKDKDSNPVVSSTKKLFNNTQNLISGVWGSAFGSQRDKEEWIVVCPKTRIAPGEIVPVVAAGLDLLIVASKDGKRVYCIANSCPHLGTPLDLGTLERRPDPFTRLRIPGDAPPEPLLSEVAEGIREELGFRGERKDGDGCEDCIVCPLHRTAFALRSGEVRGEWCPYPPIVGKIMGTVKSQSILPTFSIRTRGKNIEVRINTAIEEDERKKGGGDGKKKKGFLNL